MPRSSVKVQDDGDDVKLDVRAKGVRVKVYQCERCPRKFDRPCSLRQHFLTHTGERPHECVCETAFAARNNLYRHQRKCLTYQRHCKDLEASEERPFEGRDFNPAWPEPDSKPRVYDGRPGGGAHPPLGYPLNRHQIYRPPSPPLEPVYLDNPRNSPLGPSPFAAQFEQYRIQSTGRPSVPLHVSQYAPISPTSTAERNEGRYASSGAPRFQSHVMPPLSPLSTSSGSDFHDASQPTMHPSYGETDPYQAPPGTTLSRMVPYHAQQFRPATDSDMNTASYRHHSGMPMPWPAYERPPEMGHSMGLQINTRATAWDPHGKSSASGQRHIEDPGSGAPRYPFVASSSHPNYAAPTAYQHPTSIKREPPTEEAQFSDFLNQDQFHETIELDDNTNDPRFHHDFTTTFNEDIKPLYLLQS